MIHSVSLASHVSTHLLIHLSAHLCHHHYSHHPSLQAQNVPFQQILPILILLQSWTAFTTRGPYRAGLIMLLGLFLVRFSLIFLFVPCGGASWLHVSFFLTQYRIVYRFVKKITVCT